MPSELAGKRDLLAGSLRAQGFAPLACDGTYFLTVDLAASGVACDDRSFCLAAVKEAGVAAIPVSAFYEEDPPTSIIRLAFCKQDEILLEGARRLARARDRIGARVARTA